MNFRSNKVKIVASIAVVGTVAAVAALLGTSAGPASAKVGGNRLL